MNMIADILLIAGAVGAGFYCLVLSRRLNRLNDLETGVGGAVAVLSAQVDELKHTLTTAQEAASASASSLKSLTQKAEAMSDRLELHLASMQDVPDAARKQEPAMAAKPVQQNTSEPVFIRHSRAVQE